ncbi:hypothetical protein EDB83DRAFT_2314961 [Lactarius deliciosus]|nr:hypothetical protein EDB83DRAFT_2314961 [Lactarius deliciosus]
MVHGAAVQEGDVAAGVDKVFVIGGGEGRLEGAQPVSFLAAGTFSNTSYGSIFAIITASTTLCNIYTYQSRVYPLAFLPGINAHLKANPAAFVRDEVGLSGGEGKFVYAFLRRGVTVAELTTEATAADSSCGSGVKGRKGGHCLRLLLARWGTRRLSTRGTAGLDVKLASSAVGSFPLGMRLGWAEAYAAHRALPSSFSESESSRRGAAMVKKFR